MTTYQFDLLGTPHAARAIAANTITERVTYILEAYPDTRNSYKLLIARYWLEFDGLRQLLQKAPLTVSDFLQWILHATPAKSIQNRGMEAQNIRPDLEASPIIEQRRQRQAGAGLPRY